MRLLVFGPGYSALAAIARLQEAAESVVATARSVERARMLEARGIEPVFFAGETSAELGDAIAGATHILVSIPPGEAGDPVLTVTAPAVAAAPELRSVVYLSTVGVYGDHAGAWVDETTAPNPKSARSMARLAAEAAWCGHVTRAGAPLAILRLAGIYGPGRNALANLRDGTARRIVKPGQVFNRIHVADIASAVAAAFRLGVDGIFNVTDDEPGPPQDVIAFAAGLLGIDPPPEIPFDSAELSPMARSFYGENKRVRNDRLKNELGLELAYPTYREGLRALMGASA